VATVTGEGGTDEAWYNPTANQYSFARSTAGVLRVVPGLPRLRLLQTTHQPGSAHTRLWLTRPKTLSQVYVPIRTSILTPVTTAPSAPGKLAKNPDRAFARSVKEFHDLLANALVIFAAFHAERLWYITGCSVIARFSRCFRAHRDNSRTQRGKGPDRVLAAAGATGDHATRASASSISGSRMAL
jgi:hypothetical protein